MHMSRRRFLAAAGCALCTLPATVHAAPPQRKKLAVITTVYRQYSHSAHIAGRFLFGYSLHGQPHLPDYEVASMYVDQAGEDDLSAGLAQKFGFRRCSSIREALVLGGNSLAVDGVLLIGEHGDYPVNELGQTLYPRYEMFAEIVAQFRRAGRTAPVFNDKHLSYSWAKAKQMADWSRELNFPLQAGSSLPVTWRFPELELPLETQVETALAVAFGRPEIYGFHLLETLQCHVERRRGGETGVRKVQAISGDAVWRAGAAGEWPQELLAAALDRSHTAEIGTVRDNARDPLLYLIDYRDGFRASALMLNGHVQDFTFAARIAGRQDPVSTLHYLPERPGVKYFDALTFNIERMLAAGKAVVPLDRTLLVSGVLESLLRSRFQNSKPVETPHLAIAYRAPADSGYLHNPVDPRGQRDLRAAGG